MYDLSNIYLNRKAESRSISAENPTGEKGNGAKEIPDDQNPARALGQGWKVRPCITIGANETVTLADIQGPGLITHIWTTCNPAVYRDLVLRFYWDDEPDPSVEVPYGDFFCNGWCKRTNVLSLPINVNPAGGFNSYWPMPFRKRARITVENQRPEAVAGFFYQIDYTLEDILEDSLYFHAQWRRQNPVPYATEYTILDNVRGKGRFAGVYLAWGQNNNGWWGEGEVKFYIDGDGQFPTICGTGTEDYFGGAWSFVSADNKSYETYCAPFLGYCQLIKPDGFLNANTRHGLYRWHIMDPIHFETDFKATIQALGWRNTVNGQMEFLTLQDDLASMAVWYQLEPHVKFGQLPDRRYREVV
jgi:hypothetical protein